MKINKKVVLGSLGTVVAIIGLIVMAAFLKNDHLGIGIIMTLIVLTPIVLIVSAIQLFIRHKKSDINSITLISSIVVLVFISVCYGISEAEKKEELNKYNEMVQLIDELNKTNLMEDTISPLIDDLTSSYDYILTGSHKVKTRDLKLSKEALDKLNDEFDKIDFDYMRSLSDQYDEITKKDIAELSYDYYNLSSRFTYINSIYELFEDEEFDKFDMLFLDKYLDNLSK